MVFLRIIMVPTLVSFVCLALLLVIALASWGQNYILYSIVASLVAMVLTLILLQRNLRKEQVGFWRATLAGIAPLTPYALMYLTVVAWSEGLLRSSLLTISGFSGATVISLVLSIPLSLFSAGIYRAGLKSGKL